MQFKHAQHEEVHRQVERYLDELFDDPYEDPENGHFYVGYGSTLLEVSVEPYGPEEVLVLITAYCVQGVRTDEQLLLGLLELNHEMPVGAFSLVGDDIFFAQTLFGRNLQSRDLLGAIAAVANVSDEYDERIVAKYGGQTALDRIRDTGGRRQRKQAPPA